MSFTNKELQKILKRFPSDAIISLKIKDGTFAAQTINATLSSDNEWVVELCSDQTLVIEKLIAKENDNNNNN